MTIQEILEAHYVSLTIESRLWCRTCGLITEERHFSATKNHELKLAHVAEVLDKHMQEREAAVIAGLAELLYEYQNSHDVAECAAHVEGEVGRQEAMENWERVTDEPAEWLREQSMLHHERGFDYLQQARYEAWYEGWAEFDADAENPYADEEPTDGR